MENCRGDVREGNGQNRVVDNREYSHYEKRKTYFVVCCRIRSLERTAIGGLGGGLVVGGLSNTGLVFWEAMWTKK